MNRGLPRGMLGACLLGAIAMTWPALAGADVKSGVDAWSRGEFDAAVAEWRGLAEAGDPDALFNLAQAYRLGRGVAADAAMAEALYARAASLGHARAADTYGLLLFQSGRREAALPFVQTAARRGDPRSQYLLGIAHFNGDLVAKDWVRAYALLTLANSQGLPQAAGALTQMDTHVPLDERQQAQDLVQALRAESDILRARDLAAADLVGDEPFVADTPAATTSAATPMGTHSIASAPVLPSIAAARAAVAEATRVTGTQSPASAGADHARPPTVTVTIPAPTPSPVVRPSPPPATAAGEAGAAAGPWRVQLGAFGVAGNAQALWSRIKDDPALAGRSRILEPAGRLTKLLAGGFATRADAARACSALQRSGRECLVVR